MPEIRCQLTRGGSYWIDVLLGNMRIGAMIDSGLVDAADRLGFELDPQVYDYLLQSGRLLPRGSRLRRDASGRRVACNCGVVEARLFSPSGQQPVGPLARVEALRGAPGLPNRVGLAFFHRLTGCRVLWDLDARTWCIEYP